MGIEYDDTRINHVGRKKITLSQDFRHQGDKKQWIIVFEA